MQLREKRFDGNKKRFVGRMKEIEVLKKHVVGDGEWQWIHIYGQSGIGKTALLQQIKSTMENITYYSLDGSQGIMKKEDLLVQLAEQIKLTDESEIVKLDSDDLLQMMNNKARFTKSTHYALIIDDFDLFRPVEKWLTGWLDNLDVNIRIITAGQHPLTGGWLKSGWSNLIYKLHLPGLTQLEVAQFAKLHGVTSNKEQSHLYHFSNGIPLAMTLATEMILQKKESFKFKSEEKSRILSILIENLYDGLPSSVCKLLEAASVFWRFNEERLAAIMDKEIDVHLFRDLTMMPYVLLKEDGWMLHDAIRSWVLEDLIQRKPLTYEEMRKKALQQIRLEEQKNPKLRNKLHLDKMYLHENEMVRNICFTGHIDEVELRECREIDIPCIESLYIRYNNYVAPAVPEERYMEKLIRPIWEVDPTSFITIWQKDELIAFYSKIPLNAEMIKVLENEPLLQTFLKEWTPIPNAFLLSIIGIEPKLESKTSGFIVNTLINHLSYSEWIFDFTCIKEWFPVLELFGFTPASWANTTTPFGTEYRAYILDLTQEDYLTKLDRLLTKEPYEKNKEKYPTSKDIQDLKKILKGWDQFGINPTLADTYFRLFPHHVRYSETIKSTSLTIQDQISNFINTLLASHDQDVTLGKLLKYKYLQGNQSHERIAERLNLSMATYYRYLNKALERLYHLLSNH